MTLLLALCTLAALSWAALFASTLLDRGQLLRDASAPPPAGEVPERVVVVVPARNEAHQIAACVRSLLLQSWPDLHVIVVDDRSDDGTSAAVEALRLEPLLQAARGAALPLTLVRGAPLPAGWLGKNWANFQGSSHAEVRGAPWLLFTDADTVHAPAALATALAAARAHRSSFVSMFTGLELVTAAEKAFLPNAILAVAALFPARLVHDPRSSFAIANGQFILVRRDAYERIGGHAAIRARVCDDLELARAAKRSGCTLRVLWGHELVRVRMYTSFREIWWGFAKNAAHGVGGPGKAIAAALLALVSLLPFFLLPFAAWLSAPVVLAASAAVVLALAQRLYCFSWLFPRISPLWGLALPVSQLVMAGITLHSAARVLSGKGPRWKGREYPDAR